jgi:hypothetical protein
MEIVEVVVKKLLLVIGAKVSLGTLLSLGGKRIWLFASGHGVVL